MAALFLLTISIYGIAWILTKSSLFQGLRAYIARKELAYLSKLFNCIVCMSVWVSVGLLLLLDPTADFRLYHYIIAAGYAAGSTWIIASLIGDAS